VYEILLTEEAPRCGGCHHYEHAEGQCAASNSAVMAAVFGFVTCMCGQRLTGNKDRRVNSRPTGGKIGDHPTIRGDRR